MQEFEELKHIWQQSTSASQPGSLPNVSKASALTKTKLQRTQRNGAICLVLTALFIAGLGFWGGFNFKYWYTYAAMALVCVICLAQAGLMFYIYHSIKQIDETAPTTEHLLQWEAYYTSRQRLIRWNGPLYFLLLSLAMGLYLWEVLARASGQFQLVSLSIYLGWMVIAYFYLGKKVLKKEEQRIMDIIEHLKQLEMQLKE
ncbi:hypothetical protein K3G39_14550 [Pontibacter sp. HSC-14F20]|uniref:hypothetical protein n=1 Tax=Pontibacter sp. HSC-14F20 TaxID=2864136 RepID=UPI001C72B7D8|nr:hypothetical protein [Pontibacter sp. HSC-14F20]MBX0334459.1 hypothetical protein [Pontibacter sp. HSC-14F20]